MIQKYTTAFKETVDPAKGYVGKHMLLIDKNRVREPAKAKVGYEKNGEELLKERFNPNNEELNTKRFEKLYGNMIVNRNESKKMGIKFTDSPVKKEAKGKERSPSECKEQEDGKDESIDQIVEHLVAKDLNTDQNKQDS